MAKHEHYLLVRSPGISKYVAYEMPAAKTHISNIK
jgi:hypothetical protein